MVHPYSSTESDTNAVLFLSASSAAVGFLIALTLFLGFLHDLINDSSPNLAVYVEKESSGALVVTAYARNLEGIGPLEIGDRIIRSGSVTDLPSNRLDFRYLIATTREATVERAGSTLDLDLGESLYPAPAAQPIRIAILIVLGLLVALFGRREATTFLSASMLFLFAVFGPLSPIGPNEFAHHFLVVSHSIGWAMVWPISICAFASFQRTPRFWPWLFLPVGMAFYATMTNLVPMASQTWFAGIAIGCTVAVAVAVRTHRKSTSTERQQLNWIMSMAAIVVPCTLLALFLVPALELDASVSILVLVTAFVPLLIPFGMMMAVLRAGLGGIDKTATISVTYGIIVVVFALLFEFVFEPLAGALSSNLGFPESVGQTSLIVLAALGAPKLKQFLTPRVSRALSSSPTTESRPLSTNEGEVHE